MNASDESSEMSDLAYGTGRGKEKMLGLEPGPSMGGGGLGAPGAGWSGFFDWTPTIEEPGGGLAGLSERPREDTSEMWSGNRGWR